MASKPKKRKGGRTLPPLTREMLLPLSAKLAAKISLHNHLALVTLRIGEGNADLIAELLTTIYVAFDLLDPDQRATLVEQFLQAEATIKVSITRAAATEQWRLAGDECKIVERIVGLHDQQLLALPKHLIVAAKTRLMRVCEKGSFPSLTLEAKGKRPSR